jgi:hypothetical protein
MHVKCPNGIGGVPIVHAGLANAILDNRVQLPRLQGCQGQGIIVSEDNRVKY